MLSIHSELGLGDPKATRTQGLTGGPPTWEGMQARSGAFALAVASARKVLAPHPPGLSLVCLQVCASVSPSPGDFPDD